MIITIDIAMDTARIAAALADLKREGGMRRGVYPKQVAAGKLTQVQADAQINALADAYRIVAAVLIEVEELPFMAAAVNAQQPTSNAQQPVIEGLPELPYDKAKSLTKGAPACRFCGREGTRSKARSSDTWTCDNVGCTGGQGYVARDIFQGGK